MGSYWRLNYWRTYSSGSMLIIQSSGNGRAGDRAGTDLLQSGIVLALGVNNLLSPFRTYDAGLQILLFYQVLHWNSISQGYNFHGHGILKTVCPAVAIHRTWTVSLHVKLSSQKIFKHQINCLFTCWKFTTFYNRKNKKGHEELTF